MSLKTAILSWFVNADTTVPGSVIIDNRGAGGHGLTVITDNDNQLRLDASGQFSSLYFQHGGVDRGQFFWNETGNGFTFDSFKAGATVGFSASNSNTGTDILIQASHDVWVSNGDFYVRNAHSIIATGTGAGNIVLNPDATYATSVQTPGVDNYNRFISASGNGEYGIWTDSFYFQSLDNLANGIQFIEGNAGSPSAGGGIWLKPKSGNPVHVEGVDQLKAFTIAGLPPGVAGMRAYITDGDGALAWGATAVNSGAGATKYQVWYNGTNWTVVGK